MTGRNAARPGDHPPPAEVGTPPDAMVMPVAVRGLVIRDEKKQAKEAHTRSETSSEEPLSDSAHRRFLKPKGAQRPRRFILISSPPMEAEPPLLAVALTGRT